MLQARKRWRRRSACEDLIAELQEDLQINALAARLLAVRGVRDAAHARSFLAKRLQDLYRPQDMLGMQAAAQRFAKALDERQRILIHGDFDVDGSTSTALLKLFARACGHDAEAWIPHRVDDGYGLSQSSLQAVQEHRAELLITCDCGIVDGGWAARIEEETGCDVIVTDHHLPQAELPRCHAIVDPNQPGCDYPDKGLAGVGVAWKLCWATACRLCGQDRLTDRLRGFMLDALSLVAVGTVADCAPLGGENRILVHHGLQALAETRNHGLRALLDHCRLHAPISTDDIGWKIGPLLNASGRLSHALRNVALLCAPDAATAEGILAVIIEENAERRRLSQMLTEDLISEAETNPDLQQRASLVFAGDSWHPGVVGIVASRLCERFGKPACVIACEAGLGRGSLRSVPGVHLGEAIEACRAHLIKGGGHAAAAGVSLRQEDVASFAEAFEAHISRLSPHGVEAPAIDYDASIAISDLAADFYDLLRQLEPFGIDNPQPIVQIEACRFVAKPSLFGRNGDHIRGALTDAGGGIQQILSWKNRDAWSIFASPGSTFSMLLRPENNHWRGQCSGRLVFVDGQSQ